jgi:hypothetical protein
MLSPDSQTGINNPFAWNAVVEELPHGPHPGRRWTLWLNGGGATREDVAKFVREHYPQVKAITIERAVSLPTRPLQRVPFHFYEWGYRDKALGLTEPANAQPASIASVRKPISLKPLVP